MTVSQATTASPPASPLAGLRVTVTGGAGFLGRFVVDALRARGVQQIFIPRSRDYNLVSADETDRLYRDARPDVLIHLAASVGGIGANRANPGRFFYENMAMGLNVIEGARKYGLRKLVFIGTTCAYPKYTPVPFKEEDLWAGYPEETNAPYGVAKRALLVMLQAYRAQYGLNGIYLLPANLYGPGDNFDLETSHVIPALIRKFVEACEQRLPTVWAWGTGTPSREFLYVKDAAEGIVLAAERYDRPDPVNLGTGHEIQIRELVRMIADLTGFRGEILWDASKPDGQPRRRLDTSRALAEFGFRAETPLEEGLRQTIDWFESSRARIAASSKG